jgi:CheY-like chemotaxis protein
MTNPARRVNQSRAFGERPNTLRIGSGTRLARLTRVLIVDDDPIVGQIVAAILGGHGYDVMVRGEALGTLSIIAREKPDVVLLDVNMPGLDGDELARLVKVHADPRTRVILHSSQPQDELEQLAREAGAIGGIEKGDPTEFLEAFENLLG